MYLQSFLIPTATVLDELFQDGGKMLIPLRENNNIVKPKLQEKNGVTINYV